MLSKLTGEQKLATGIFGATLLWAVVKADKIKEGRRKAQDEDRTAVLANAAPGVIPRYIQKVPTATDRLVDHPAFQYILENSMVILIALASFKTKSIFGKGKTFWQRFWNELASLSVGEEGQVISNWMLTNVVYKHIPAFAENVKSQTVFEVCSDFATCNLPVFVAMALFEAGIGSRATKADKAKGFFKGPFRPVRFLVALICTRIVTDFLFFAGHYLLHLRSLYFIHKRHHEHNKVKIFTNYHFSPTDLTIEALLPLVFSLVFLKAVNRKFFTLPPWEVSIISGYIFQLEVASHAGKAVPFMSTIPPFSPFLTKWDNWNPWFHAMHHKLLRCNYSITPFWDWLFGTDRY